MRPEAVPEVMPPDAGTWPQVGAHASIVRAPHVVFDLTTIEISTWLNKAVGQAEYQLGRYLLSDRTNFSR